MSVLEVKVVRAEVLEQVRRYKFTELTGEARRLLDHDWLVANGLRVAAAVGGEGDEYVVYRPRPAAFHQPAQYSEPARYNEYARNLLQQMAEVTSHVTDVSSGLPGMNGPSEEAGGAQLTPETMTAARIALQNAPLRQDSIASRILNGRGPLLSQRYQWSDGDTQFVLDDTVPPGEVALKRAPEQGRYSVRVVPVRADGQPMEQDAANAAQAIVDHYASRFEQYAYGDGDGSGPVLEQQAVRFGHHRTANNLQCSCGYIGQSQAFLERHFVELGLPGHYRVRGGECVCGFRNNWTQDMARHIADEIVMGSGGVPKRWKVCECGASRLCREVVRPSIVVPDSEHIYLCDTCCERQGIR